MNKERRIKVGPETAHYLREQRHLAALYDQWFRAAVDALLLEARVTGDVTLVGLEGNDIVVMVPDPEKNEEGD